MKKLGKPFIRSPFLESLNTPSHIDDLLYKLSSTTFTFKIILYENVEDKQNKNDLREVEFYCLEKIENFDKYTNDLYKIVNDYKNR